MYERIIAAKYARAFLHVFGQQPDDFLERLQEVTGYFAQHRKAFFYIKLAIIPAHIKQSILMRIFERAGLTVGFTQLLALLGRHRRYFLLLDVLDLIQQEYKKIHGIEEFVITVADDIVQSDADMLINFLKQASEKKIWYTLVKDESLIAGARAQSEEHLWEHSVKQFLHHIERGY